MIAERGFVEKGIEQAVLDMIDDPFYSKLIDNDEERLNLYALVFWRDKDKDYVIDLQKRLKDWSEYILRLYPDGSGYLIYEGKKDRIIRYFVLEDDALMQEIISDASENIDRIAANPRYHSEDDRWTIPVHLEYNIEWKYPDIEERDPNIGNRHNNCDIYYDNIVYVDDESKLPIIKKASEIRFT